MRSEDEQYFDRIESRLDEAIALADRARAQGGDPSPEVEIPVAKDMADRVENILGIEGVAKRVRELEGEMSREEAALELVTDFVEGTVGDYDTRAGKVEGAVRTAVALLTEGVVAAPIEGIDSVELLQNDDGTEFVNVYYAGPIRSAGGTAQALSVLVADYARSLLGIEEFSPRADEVERYAEEVALYDKETGLQYTPSDAETKFIAEHVPIMLDGEATGNEEVSGFRDLERVSTNSTRGGMCLVLAEGIALKAPKIQRYTRQLDEVDWPWLQDLIDGTYYDDAGTSPTQSPAESTDETSDSEKNTTGSSSAEEGSPSDECNEDGGSNIGPEEGGSAEAGPPRVERSSKYLRDLIAGRPVFGHPSESGGFRLRYGRARNHGFATAGVHPATMHLVDDFLATGTQIKTERPGKAAGVVPVDSIEGPTVKLANGDVRRIDDPSEALDIRNGVVSILDLGEYLVNYGEFVENNHPLAPASYTVEWWEQDLSAAGANVQALRDDPGVDLADPGAERALAWAEEYDAPLHPAYTYLWHDLPVETFEALADAVSNGRFAAADGATVESPTTPDDEHTLVIPRTDVVCEALETLLVEHRQGEETVTIQDALPLVLSLGFTETLNRTWSSLSERAKAWGGGDNSHVAVSEVAPFELQERAPTRIGNRMGRPEKSETRELSPAVHTLFPIAEGGGSQRDVAAAAKQRDATGRPGEVQVEVARRECTDCGSRTFHPRCQNCSGLTVPHYQCPTCEIEANPDESGQAVCPRCGNAARATETRVVDIGEEYREAMANVGERPGTVDMVKGVKGLTSTHKVPEPMEKGVLRAKNGVSAFKDGTVRYDMTDLPVTSVRAAELDIDVDQLRSLGYSHDIDGDPLEHADQLVELKVQDVVLSDGAAEHMLKTANYVDDLLERYYGLEAFYDVADRQELVGELVFGMAPHTSAATVGRVIGFTSAAVGYAHPYFHAAKRRNCFHPDTTVHYEDEHGQWHREPIKDFVEERLADPREDDFGTLVQEIDGSVRVQSINDDGNTVVQPVEAVSKHRAPEHMVRVETRRGRSLTVTPDHEVLRWNEGIERIAAPDLEPGDKLPVGPMMGPTNPNPAATDGSDVASKVEIVERVQYVPTDVEYTYCLTVEETHSLFANGVATGQCDGDEDCVMLLMDGLLNFSKQYLPDKRGGSVAEDSRLVTVSPEGDVQFLTFDEFWNELDSDAVRDGKFRKKTCLSEGWQTYVFGEGHRASIKPIEKAIRYRASANETILRIETQFGRSIDITANHSLFRYADGIEEVAGDELKEGDLLLAPRQLDVETVETTIDVTECIDNPYVFIDEHIEELLTTARESAGRQSTTQQALGNGLTHRPNTKIALSEFEETLSTDYFEGIPSNVKVGLPHSSMGIRRTLEVDASLGWLLGLFIAEGTLSSDNPCINTSDEELVERTVEIATDTLGTEPEIRLTDWGYEIRLPEVLKGVLYDLGFECSNGDDSSETTLPGCILRAPRNVVIAFLQGFIAGDSSDSSGDNGTTVGVHTTSEDVKDGIVFLLHRLGVVANVSYETDCDGNRQSSYTVSVSGGANDSPLHRIFNGDEPYLPKTLVVSISNTLKEIREVDHEGVNQLIEKHLTHPENVSLEELKGIVDELDDWNLPSTAQQSLEELRPLVYGDLSYLRVKNIEVIEYDGYLYDLQVGGEPIFTANWLYAHNSMDAPLVMSSRIDPSEIDDEAHNMDIVDRYPREFYQATREMADPESVDVTIAEEHVGTDREYTGFRHTHDTSDLALGPDLSAYKTLGSMMDKMDAQLELARKLRAVDETDVAERVIEYHFLPDLIGNLRAFSRQETRCLDCGEKYRRMPLTGDCRECGGRVNLTVHRGSVNKYMDTAKRVAEEYGCREYTKQRLEILEKSLDSVFENDKNRASSLSDFM